MVEDFYFYAPVGPHFISMYPPLLTRLLCSMPISSCRASRTTYYFLSLPYNVSCKLCLKHPSFLTQIIQIWLPSGPAQSHIVYMSSLDKAVPWQSFSPLDFNNIYCLFYSCVLNNHTKQYIMNFSCLIALCTLFYCKL